MKKQLLLLLVLTISALGDVLPPPPASVAETQAGAIKNKYVSPYDLANSIGTSSNAVVQQGTASASGIWTNGQVVGGLIVGQGSISNRQLTVSGNLSGNDGIFLTNAGSGDVDIVLQGSGTAGNPNFSMTATKAGSWFFYNHSVNAFTINRGVAQSGETVGFTGAFSARSTGRDFIFENNSSSTTENVAEFQQDNALYYAAISFFGDDKHEHFATGWGNSQANQSIFKNRVYTEVSDIPPSGTPTNLPPLYVVVHSGAFPSVPSNSIHSVIAFASSGLQQDFMFGGTNSIDSTNPPVTFYHNGNGRFSLTSNTNLVSSGGYSMTNPPPLMPSVDLTVEHGIGITNGGLAILSNSIPASVTVGASPFLFTNTTPFDLRCDVGGTTAITTTLGRNGVTIIPSTTDLMGEYTLYVGEYLTLTYSGGTPTLVTNR